MSTLIAQQARVFARRWTLASIAAGLIALNAAAGIHEAYLAGLPGPDFMNGLGDHLRYSILWPLAVLVLSFESASGARFSGMDEAIEAHAATAHRHWLATMVPPAAVVLTLFAVTLAAKLIPVFTEGWQRSLGWHLTAFVVLNVLAPCTIALLLGFFAARRFTRFAGYALVAAFALLVGPFSEIIPMVAQAAILRDGNGLDLYPLRDLFGVLAPDPTWYVDPLYGFPLEQSRWLLAGFWISLLTALLLPSLTAPRRRWGRLIRAGLLCGSAVLLIAFLAPSSELRRDFRLSGGSSQVSEQTYYSLQADNHPKREEPGGFSVSRYDMDLSAGRELDVVATVRIADDEHTGDYRFTLYHGYRLTRVLDAQGRPLRFSQEGDYTTVRSPQKQEQLTFDYRGSGGIYIANSQGVFLPGYFPYYPVPGFVHVWDELRTAPAMDVAGFKPAEFSVRFDAPVPLASDLEMRRGYFEGYASAPTFVGGLVAQTRIAERRVAFYPVSRPDLDGLEVLIARVDDLERDLGIAKSSIPDTITVLQAPEFHALGGATRLPGALLVKVFDDSVAGEVIVASTPARLDRSNLKEAFAAYLSNPTDRAEGGSATMGIRSADQGSSEETPTARDVALLERTRRSARTDFELVQGYVYPAKNVVLGLFHAKILAQGEAVALKDTYRYLSSDSELSELEFLTGYEHTEMQ